MCVCVCVCVCVCAQINHEPSSSWSVISTGGAARAAPRVFQGPPALPVLLAPPPQPSFSQATLSLPGRVPQVVLQRARAYLVLVLEAGRKEGSRKSRREGGKDINSHRRSTELKELNFLTLTLCTAYS